MYNRYEKINLKEYNNAYIVGDIHGAFDQLENALYAIQFDKERDLLICVGDLVGRGEKSNRAHEYLSKKWFKTVIGNHDLLFVEKEIGNGLIPQIDQVEYDILFKDKLKTTFINAYRESPLLMDIKNKNGARIIVSHASLPEFEGDFDSFLNNYMSNDLSVMTVKELTWTRRIKKDFDTLRSGKLTSQDILDINKRYIVDGVDYVFHGHNVVFLQGLNKKNANELLKIGNRYLIDTGAFYLTDNYKHQYKNLRNDYYGVGFTLFDLNKVKCVFVPAV